MEALVPAFIAALFAQVGDRSPWLAAILADRYGKPFTIAIAALLAHALGNGIAAAGGAWVAPLLTPNARQLLVALALAAAAAGALWRLKPPERLDDWPLSAALTGFLGIFILALGDTTQFFAFVFATHGPSPWLAAIGTTLAAFVVTLIAALAGERSWRKLPLRAVRIGFGVLCVILAAILAASALRLA